MPAKINLTKLSTQRDHVLCLYYANDSRKRELTERYASTANLRYRYWKADANTLAGRYSQAFLDSLKPKGSEAAR
jgi:hypothetical protein